MNNPSERITNRYLPEKEKDLLELYLPQGEDDCLQGERSMLKIPREKWITLS